MNFSTFLINTLLTEANVLNIQVPLNGVSLSNFLDQNLEDVPETSRAAFKKKLTKLFVNDERYHTPVTQLPANAPEWAVNALEQGQPLVAFRPTATLAAELEHMGHYIGALEQDQAGNDPDKKAVATRELAGIARAENLDLIMQKSNEYFTRGTKNVQHSNEGTKLEMQLPSGFFWVLLQSMDAYRREGKVLQNCIGTHWLPSKADRIYVLKTRKNESVVAIRVANNAEVQEVKGKNNKPPVARYMPSVAEFLNSKNWSLAYGGQNDVRNAGYVLADGVLMTRDEALEKYVPDSNHINIAGNKIRVVDANNISKEVRSMLFPNMNQGEDMMYEMHVEGSRPVIFKVKNGQLTGVERPTHNYGERLSAEDNARMVSVLTELVKDKKIHTVSDSLLKQMGLDAYVVKDGEIVKKSNVSSDQILGKEPISREQVINAVRDWSEHFRSNEKGENPLADVVDSKIIPVQKGVYNRNGYNAAPDTSSIAAHVLLKHEDGHITMLELVRAREDSDLLGVGRAIPVSQKIWSYGTSAVHDESIVTGNDKRADTVKPIVDHANESSSQLPMSYRIRAGIVGQPGSYKIFDPEAAMTRENDISHISFDEFTDKTDRMIALATAIAKTTDTNDEIVRSLGQEIRASTDPGSASHGRTKLHSFGNDTTRRDLSKPLTAWANKTFGSTLPDDMYYIDNGRTFGIPVFVTGNEITRIGDQERELEGRGRHQEEMKNQLQKLIDNTGVKLSKAVKQLSPELEFNDGKFSLRGERETAAREQRRAGRTLPSEIKFQDGAKIREVTGRDAYDYLSAIKHKTRTGDVYNVIGPEGKSVGFFTVDNGKVTDVTSGTTSRAYGTTLPHLASGTHIQDRPTKSSKITKYIAGAGPALGLNPEDEKVPVIQPNKNGHKVLKVLASGGRMARTAAYRAAGASAAGVQGWDSSTVPVDRTMVDAGFLNASKEGRSIVLNITERGRKALEALNQGSKVRAQVRPAAVVDGTPVAVKAAPKPVEKPKAEPKAATPRATPAPAAGGEGGDDDLGGGSKMDRAMRLWDKYVEDNGEAPRRGTFIDLMIDKLGMTKAGASTYAQTVKVRKAQAAGQVNERLSFIDFLMIVNE